MEHNEQDSVRIECLLRHTSEFIAYFELAEIKMHQWQEGINQQATRLEQCALAIKNDLSALMNGEHFLAQSTEHFQQASQQCFEQLQQQLSQASNELVTQLQHTISLDREQQKENIPKTGNPKRVFNLFTIRHSVLALFTTLLTTFILALYLNDEYPWELHQQAINERQAGKALLAVWPKLSQEERSKILKINEPHHG